MRVLKTAVAASLAVGLLGLATPAFADSNGYGNRSGGGTYGQGKPPQTQPYQGGGYDDDDRYDDSNDRGGYRDGYDGRDDDRAYDRNENAFQSWERGWDQDRRGDRWGHHGHGRQLSYRQIVRRIERQGYYDVRRLRPSRHGFGWRAFARYRLDGHRAMLRVDPFTGRVIASRHI